MGATRCELTDAQWRRIEAMLPGKSGDPSRTGLDNRLFVDGVLWVRRPAPLGPMAGFGSKWGGPIRLWSVPEADPPLRSTWLMMVKAVPSASSSR
jgi:hypothetical protein